MITWNKESEIIPGHSQRHLGSLWHLSSALETLPGGFQKVPDSVHSVPIISLILLEFVIFLVLSERSWNRCGSSKIIVPIFFRFLPLSPYPPLKTGPDPLFFRPQQKLPNEGGREGVALRDRVKRKKRKGRGENGTPIQVKMRSPNFPVNRERKGKRDPMVIRPQLADYLSQTVWLP